MFTFFSRKAARLSAGTWPRRITAALAAIAGGALAWAAAIPAASAAVIPVPGPGAAYGPAATAGTAQMITTSGMPGWQITIIAIAAALAAATAAVLLDRARASRRATATTG